MRPRLLGLTVCAGLGVVLLAAPAPAAAAPAHPAPARAAAGAAAECDGLPKHGNHPVVDAANVIPPADEAYLIADLMAYRITGHEAIVAMTVKDLGGDDVSSYAKRVFDCWGIGDAQGDDGILILLAMREQRVRIEVGAGLADQLGEGELEHALDTMVAPLRAGDVAGGMRIAATTLAGSLGNVFPDTRSGNVGTPGTRRPTARPSGNPGNVSDGGTDTPGDMPGGDVPPDMPFDEVYGIDDLPPGAGPFAPTGGGGGGGVFFLLPLLVFGGVVLSIVRAVFRGAGAGGGGTWRGGFPSHGGYGWSSPSLLRGGAWHVSDAPPAGWRGGPPGGGWRGGSSWGDSGGGSDSGSGGSGGSFGSSGSFGGSSGGSSFGGGSSGGGGASGSW